MFFSSTKKLVDMAGIEPESPACKAGIIPLYDTPRNCYSSALVSVYAWVMNPRSPVLMHLIAALHTAHTSSHESTVTRLDALDSRSPHRPHVAPCFGGLHWSATLV